MEVAAGATVNREKLASLLNESEALLTCVHCGLCLPHCPTYRELGNENDSPRGRIYLMRALVEGRIDRSRAFVSHIDLCLGCRACEPVCPSGVPYGRLLESSRVEVAQAEQQSGSAIALITRFVLNRIFTRPRLLKSLMTAARWFRDGGLARLVFDSKSFSGRAQLALALLIASRSRRINRRRVPLMQHGHRVEAKATVRVSLLRGCVMEGLFSETNRATERVLELGGCELIIVTGQVCCGALHAHAGEIDAARQLARRNIDAFSRSGCERVIVNAAGCGAAMKEYGHLLSDDPVYSGPARELSAKVRDVCEFLAENPPVPPVTRIERRVGYDAPCHLIHAQRVIDAPVDVLKLIPGVEIVPLAGFESCCGGAGIYNLLNPDLSAQILDRKLEFIRVSGADTIVTGNPGCIMQIGAGLLLKGIECEVVHPVELLNAAY